MPVTSPTKRAKEEEENLAATKDSKSSPVAKTVLRFAKLTEHAMVPTKGNSCPHEAFDLTVKMSSVAPLGSKLAAGYDLYSAYDVTIPARGKAIAKTDLQVSILHWSSDTLNLFSLLE